MDSRKHNIKRLLEYSKYILYLSCVFNYNLEDNQLNFGRLNKDKSIKDYLMNSKL